jgi:hypothetical protein
MALALADQPPVGPAAPAVTANAYEVRASLDLNAMYDRLRSETLRLLEDLSQQGLSGQELSDAVVNGLKGLSDTPIDEAARGGATEAFNLGRNLGIQDSADKVSEVVRTAVLDQNTCDNCDRLDGFTTTVNSADYFAKSPPIVAGPDACDGWDLCRCFWLVRAA